MVLYNCLFSLLCPQFCNVWLNVVLSSLSHQMSFFFSQTCLSVNLPFVIIHVGPQKYWVTCSWIWEWTCHGAPISGGILLRLSLQPVTIFKISFPTKRANLLACILHAENVVLMKSTSRFYWFNEIILRTELISACADVLPDQVTILHAEFCTV